MKKVQIALDFIMLYKSHKKGAFYYSKLKNEDYPLKEKDKVLSKIKTQ
jgi:hypothetical protein